MSLSCESFRALISREVDGCISCEDEAALMEHVNSCPACAADHRTQHLIHGAFASMEPHSVPAGLDQRVAETVLFCPRPVLFSRRWLRPLARVAVVLVTLGLIGYVSFEVGNQKVVQAERTEAQRELDRFARTLEADKILYVRDFGLSETVAESIVGLRMHYRRQHLRLREHNPSDLHERARELWEREQSQILSLLSREQLQAYCRHSGIELSEAMRLLEDPSRR